eukprot:CAMPEP_0181440462 /NCGR_PEP_ID=MMETSP1110-20121109/22981_1 /TAXON_ID=174948 /ORGANISM="Symbiodinium sp., Strain CCMP421" /LENGTH=274 /DNA_ID=CAMNT_0023564269 /DNA_START=67 /DNA_END=891 /DNA_ORIENTATION=-
MSERVFVRGFNYGTPEDTIKAHFEQVGPVTSLEMWGKGAAVVTYASPEVAQRAATELNRTTITGNTRYVEVKIDDDPKSGRADGTRVFVRGFDFGTTDEQLEAHCAQAGEIAKVQWCSKGSAIITFKEPVAEEAVKQLNNTTIPGNTRFIDVMVKEDGGFFDMRRMKGMPSQMYWFANFARYWGKGKGKGRRKEDPEGSGRVFVRGFDFGTTDEQLLEHMSAAGEVADVHWVTRGSAVVIYKEAESAKKAVDTLHNSTIANNTRYIDVIQKESE